jgi:hypothetical protein
MKPALHRIFLKNWAILLVVFALFGLYKYSAANRGPMAHQHLDQWVQQCAGAPDEAIEALAEEISAKMVEDENYAEAVSEDFKEFTNSYGNRRTVSGWIAFARDGQGAGGSLPANMTRFPEFYAGLEQPWIMNGEYLDLYAELQELDVVSILVVLLSIVFWGMHYEMEIYRFTDTVRDGRVYAGTLRTVLLVISLVMLIINEFVDLNRSGLLDHDLFWKTPVQSYTPMRNCGLNATMLEAFTLMWIGKVINTVLLCAAAELVARRCKSVKDSTVAMFIVLLGLMFLGKAFYGSDWFSLIQLGAVEWIPILQKTGLLWSASFHTAALGLALLCLITILAVLIQWTPPCRGIRKLIG